MRQTLSRRLGAILVVSATVVSANAQHAVVSDVVSSGATNSTSASYSLRGTVSQATVGAQQAGNKSIRVGFWYAAGGFLPSGLLADLRLFLEGPYTGSQQMSADLTDVAPSTQPYGDPAYAETPIYYEGPESVDSLAAGMVDWVVVELRADTSSASKVASRAALLREDGFVRDLDGVSSVKFEDIPSGDYFVVVRHGNHVPVMSAAAVSLGTSPTAVDFTSAAGSAFGVDALKQVESGVYALFGGDENQDGQVTAPDFNSYLVATTGGVTGYVRADFNRDGQVTAPDFNIYLANTALGAATRFPDGTSGALAARSPDAIGPDSTSVEAPDVPLNTLKRFPWEEEQ